MIGIAIRRCNRTKVKLTGEQTNEEHRSLHTQTLTSTHKSIRANKRVRLETNVITATCWQQVDQESVDHTKNNENDDDVQMIKTKKDEGRKAAR